MECSISIYGKYIKVSIVEYELLKLILTDVLLFPGLHTTLLHYDAPTPHTR